MAKEIESNLRETYVKNVYSLGSSQVLRFGVAGGDDVWIVASPKLGVWMSRNVAERAETTDFTTRLRREVVRARFISCAQVDLDRIVDITLGEGEYQRHLVVELVPPGNVIVTDAEMKVILSLNDVRSHNRRLVSGSTYSPPPQRRKSPSEAEESDITSALRTEDTVGGLVGRSFSLPRKYVAEVLARLGVKEDTPSMTLAGREKTVVQTMRDLVHEAEAAPWPCICETPNGDELFVVAPRSCIPKSSADSVSELCDVLFLTRLVTEAEVAEVTAPSKKRELEVTILKLRSQERGLISEATRVRELAKEARSAASFAEALSFMKSAGVQARREPVSQEAVVSSIYNRAKELEGQAANARKAIQDLSRRLQSESKAKRRTTRALQRSKQEWYEKFRWFFTSQGKLAIGGRDAQSNSILVKRHLETNDAVFHADLFGSPFFVLKGGSGQTEQECAEVAQATVAFSSAWKTGLGSADAYWVNSDQVSTSAPSGEFLPRGGFLIRGKKNFVQHNLVELAVGLDFEGRVISGPESAIRRVAAEYVVIRPHKEKSSETAKRVLKDLQGLAGDRVEKRVTVDEVLRMLPAGGGKVLRKYSSPTTTAESRNA